jgi:hypothetical protein
MKQWQASSTDVLQEHDDMFLHLKTFSVVKIIHRVLKEGQFIPVAGCGGP